MRAEQMNAAHLDSSKFLSYFLLNIYHKKSFLLHSGNQNTRIFGEKYVVYAYVCLKRYVFSVIRSISQHLCPVPYSTLCPVLRTV